jgi:hypothetical protein
MRSKTIHQKKNKKKQKIACKQSVFLAQVVRTETGRKDGCLRETGVIIVSTAHRFVHNGGSSCKNSPSSQEVV